MGNTFTFGLTAAGTVVALAVVYNIVSYASLASSDGQQTKVTTKRSSSTNQEKQAEDGETTADALADEDSASKPMEGDRKADAAEDDANIESLFSEASEYIRNAPSSSRVGNNERLMMYGLYKQATQGKCNTSKPLLDFEGRMKWDAWNKLGTMSEEDAMKGYVDLITALYPTWRS
eukprot:CAMPEP_0167818116 /NCGR_PEP_ID=MMETSP0112_2-20121227/4616_1 /TAXON_ID=91324 /ORGANISM="Lotharella globosa, Strain CCCM811" /LENGTH=175 /DNA_ID=CAMNT_0007718045 /DNA_START=35 /DNA_END=559 /DNA_ORIENTATION=-